MSHENPNEREREERGLDPDTDSPTELLRYINNKLNDIRRILYSLDRAMANGTIITLDGGAIETAKAMYLLARGEELDEVLLAKGGKPLTPSTAREALNPLDGDDEPKTHPQTDTRTGGEQTEMNVGPAPKCPSCGVSMLVRDGRLGRFWGCPNYRSKGCRETVDIDPKPWSTGGSSGGDGKVGSFVDVADDDDDVI